MIDRETIERCKKGDRWAQQKIYDYYAPKLSGMCHRYSRTDFEVEDIFQESFIKVFKYINDYRGIVPFDAWIKKIVLNTAIDNYKKNIRLTHEISLEIMDYDMQDDTDIISMLSTQELLELIQNLPDGYRIIFNLYAIEGYSQKEISEMLDITHSTVRTQYFKAKRYIIKLLDKIKVTENALGRR